MEERETEREREEEEWRENKGFCLFRGVCAFVCVGVTLDSTKEGEGR